MGAEPLIFLFVLTVVGVVVGGGICGIVAVVRLSRLNLEIRKAQDDIRDLRKQLAARPLRQVAEAEAESAAVRVPPSVAASEERIGTPVAPEAPPRTPVAAAPPPFKPETAVSGAATAKPMPILEPTAPPKPSFELPAFELALGAKWARYAGAVMLLIGIAFFVKYAYDNSWIGPQGRLAIGTFWGMAALGVGEWFRRRQMIPLFQTMTGIGIAVFYICVFFSFQVYHLAGAGTAFGVAILVTLLAVVMAVAHDAMAIAVLGVLGGFLSPVLLSTGENHPYALFTYIILLDLVALAAAYFRRWRLLDLLCFLGTVAMYQGWYLKFYEKLLATDSQLVPGLLYLSLFYLLFLLVPTLHSLVRRLPETIEGMVLVVANAVFSFYCYYNILYADYRQALGFVVLGQALLVFLLFLAWTMRVGKSGTTGESLLVISLALVTVAVPIRLSMYGIPIAWALEGVLFVYLGIHFRQIISRIAGMAALGLAVCGLLKWLPLHKESFHPVFNVPFGSWALVIAALLAAAYMFYRYQQRLAAAGADRAASSGPDVLPCAIAEFLASFVLGCVLLSLETYLYWALSGVQFHHILAISALRVLWAIIPAATALVLLKRNQRDWMPLAWACYAVSVVVFMAGLTDYQNSAYQVQPLVLNAAFLSAVLLIMSLGFGAWCSRRLQWPDAQTVLDVAAQALLLVLLAFEIHRWSQRPDNIISPRMGMGLISAAWAVQALTLVWVGLASRNRARRITGFVVFGIAIVKAFLFDMHGLDQVYRIVSFGATGLLLLVAAYFYQRYVPVLLKEEKEEADERTRAASLESDRSDKSDKSDRIGG